MAIVGLLLLGIIASIATLCVAAVWRSLVIPKSLLSGARCGRCRYEIVHLDGGRCPECGGELLSVGVTTPAMIVERRPRTLIAAFLLVACILIILRAVRIPRSLQRGAHCGRCGYELSTLTDGRCPECGAAILRAGVTTPALALRHRSSGLIALMAWTCFVGMITSGASWVLQGLGVGRTTNWDANANIVATENLAPPYNYWDSALNRPVDSNDYAINFAIDVITNDQAIVRSGSIDLALETPDGRAVTARIDPVSLAYSVGGEPQPGTFDADAAAELIASLGFSIDSDAVQREAAQIAQVARNVRQSPDNFGTIVFDSDLSMYEQLQRFGGNSSTSRAGLSREDRRDLTLLGIAAAFWLLGAIGIYRRRRSVLKDVNVTTAP